MRKMRAWVKRILKLRKFRWGKRLETQKGRAASRGRWHPFKKRMGHIRVVLVVDSPQTTAKKIETKEEIKKAVVPSQKSVIKKHVWVPSVLSTLLKTTSKANWTLLHRT